MVVEVLVAVKLNLCHSEVTPESGVFIFSETRILTVPVPERRRM